MKKALISPMEKRENGYRVADVAAQEFPVAPPFFFVDCPNDLEADTKWYDSTTKEFKDFSIVEPIIIEQPTTTGTEEV